MSYHLGQDRTRTLRRIDYSTQTFSNRTVRAAGWCWACKQPLDDCECEPSEPAELNFENA